MAQAVQSAETLKRDQIQNTDTYKVMPDLSDEEYEALKRDIAENGVEVEVVVEAEGREIVDGHHRDDICNELGIEDYPFKVVKGLTKSEKLSLAWKLNMQRRHLNKGQKKDAAKRRIKQLDDMGEEFTLGEIADELGISDRTVGNARDELEEEGFDFRNISKIKSRKKKQEQIKQELEEDPDRTNVEIAEEIGVDQSTVAKYRKEMEEEPEKKKAEVEKSDETEKTTVEIRGRGGEDWSKIKDLIELAESGNETARKELNKVSKGEKTVSEAYKRVQKEKKKEKETESETEIEDLELSQEGRVYELNMLGWKQEAIAEKVNLSRNRVSEIVDNGDFAKIDTEFEDGKSVLEIADYHGLNPTTAWGIILEDKSDQEVFKELSITLKPYDVWNYSGCNKLMGEKDYPGRIPGQLVMNALYYYTEQGDLVADFMAGGGHNCRCLSLDEQEVFLFGHQSSERGYRRARSRRGVTRDGSNQGQQYT